MRTLPPHRFAAIAALGFALLPGMPARGLSSQDDGSTVAVLLSRARTLEQRGRLDLAKQDWAQVLAADPNDAEALAGSARAAKAEGRAGDEAMFLARLRAAHPADPQLTGLDGGDQGRGAGAALGEAARLARAGDARGAMVLYKRVYGGNPPPGAPALAYYGTEGMTEEGRPAAIAGLRALSDRMPADPRYKVALGRLLLGSPRTQAEGRTLLEAMPENQDAVAALREPAGTDGPGAAGRAAATELAASVPPTRPTEAHTQAPTASTGVETPVETARSTPPVRPQATPGGAGRQGMLLRTSSAQGGSSLRRAGYSPEEQAAFAALDAHRMAEAGQRFREILAKDPGDARALAGIGYVSVTMGDLKTAVLFFERAQESGDRSLALTRALVNAEFEFTLQQAASARIKGDLAGAETQYRAALRERPSDPGALEGLGEVLMQVGRAGDAVPVFAKLTQLRPLSPAAWRGLVLAEAATGNTQAVAAAAARAPLEAREPLQSDTAYALTVAAANRSQGNASRTQVARVEPPPPRPVPAPKPAAPTITASQPGTGTKVAARGAAPAPVTVTPAPPRSAVPAGRAAPATVIVPASPALSAANSGLSSPPPAVAAPAASSRADLVVAGERVQQGEAALLHGNNAEAAALLREALREEPDRADAWRALVGALHNGKRDAEAADVISRLPAGAQPVLERDATFETTAGAVYLNADRPGEALRALARAQDIFATQRLAPPLELAMQIARLLAARGDDENLYRQLMYLGERQDLTASQRVQVQFVWTQWAVRRARALAAGGDRRRAVTLLNAAAGAFPGNTDVTFAVADGYSGIGLPREAVALYKAQDLSAAPAREVEAAVSAATAAHDFKAAGGWAKSGLQRFPRRSGDADRGRGAGAGAGARGKGVDVDRAGQGECARAEPWAGAGGGVEGSEGGAGLGVAAAGWRAAFCFAGSCGGQGVGGGTGNAALSTGGYGGRRAARKCGLGCVLLRLRRYFRCMKSPRVRGIRVSAAGYGMSHPGTAGVGRTMEGRLLVTSCV